MKITIGQPPLRYIRVRLYWRGFMLWARWKNHGSYRAVAWWAFLYPHERRSLRRHFFIR